MAIISEKNRLIFILNPRTASSAIGNLLLKSYGGRWVLEKSILNAGGMVIVQQKHSTLEILLKHEVLDPEITRRYSKFVTVRNPFDSLVSGWVKKKNQYAHLAERRSDFFGHRLPGYMDDFEFVKNHNFSDWVRMQYSNKENCAMHRRFTKGCDFILKYEFLQGDFKAMCRKLSIPELEIPVFNKTQGKKTNYREYYDRSARQVIERAFSDELKELDYEF